MSLGAVSVEPPSPISPRLFRNEFDDLRLTLNRSFKEVLSRLDAVEMLQVDLSSSVQLLVGSTYPRVDVGSRRHSKAASKEEVYIGNNDAPSLMASPNKFNDAPDREFCVETESHTHMPNVCASWRTICSWRRWQQALRRVLKHPYFDLTIAAVVASNAVVIGIQTEYAAAHLTDQVPPELSSILGCYTAIFAIEIILRVASGAKQFFCGREWRWNWLDFVVVILSIADEILNVVPQDSTQIQSTSQFRMLRFLRLTRLIRLVRITRLLRVIRSLRMLVHQIMSTLKSLIWAIVLLTVIIFLFGVVFTQAVSSLLMGSDSSADSARVDESDPIVVFWGTLPRSMLTLFQILTSGLDWGNTLDSLREMGEGYLWFFLLYLCFSQFAVLNVITGVFCQTAIDSAEHDQELVAQSVLANEQKFAEELKSIFHDMDSTGSGAITIQQFKEHFHDAQLRAYFVSLDVDTSDVWTLFKLLDKDDGNAIDIDAFVSGIVRIRGKAKAIDLARLSYEHKWMAAQFSKFIARTDITLALLKERALGGESPVLFRQRTSYFVDEQQEGSKNVALL